MKLSARATNAEVSRSLVAHLGLVAVCDVCTCVIQNVFARPITNAVAAWKRGRIGSCISNAIESLGDHVALAAAAPTRQKRSEAERDTQVKIEMNSRVSRARHARSVRRTVTFSEVKARSHDRRTQSHDDRA